MAGETDPSVPQDPPRDLDYEQARLAYTIIQSLLAHTRVVSDLIAVMAQALDEDTQKALTQTPNWAAYLESRRLPRKECTHLWPRRDFSHSRDPDAEHSAA